MPIRRTSLTLAGRKIPASGEFESALPRAAVLLLPAIGLGGFDAVTGRRLAYTGGEPTRRYSESGVGARYGNAIGTQYLLLNNTPSGGAGTIVWYGERHATSGAAPGQPAIYRDDGGAGIGNLLWDDGASKFNVRVNGSTVGSVGSFPVDTPVCTVLTGDANGAELWADGVLVTTIAGTWAWRSSGQVLQLHNNGGPGNFNGQGLDATDYLVALYPYRMPAGLARQVSRTPAMLLRQRIWVPVAAGGGAGNVGSVFASGVFRSNVFRRAA